MELMAWYEGANMGRVLIWKDSNVGMLEIRGCLNGELLDRWCTLVPVNKAAQCVLDMDTVMLDFSIDELATSYAEAMGIKLTQESYERAKEYATIALP